MVSLGCPGALTLSRKVPFTEPTFGANHSEDSPSGVTVPVGTSTFMWPMIVTLTHYAKRQGIEGTLSQAGRAFGLRRARCRGLAETHL